VGEIVIDGSGMRRKTEKWEGKNGEVGRLKRVRGKPGTS